MFCHHQKGGDCWPKGYNLQFCLLMITKHMKLFGTNQVQECISGFKKIYRFLPLKEGVDGSRVLKNGIIAQNTQRRSNVLIREARLKIHVVD